MSCQPSWISGAAIHSLGSPLQKREAGFILSKPQHTEAYVPGPGLEAEDAEEEYHVSYVPLRTASS